MIVSERDAIMAALCIALVVMCARWRTDETGRRMDGFDIGDVIGAAAWGVGFALIAIPCAMVVDWRAARRRHRDSMRDLAEMRAEIARRARARGAIDGGKLREDSRTAADDEHAGR